MIPRPDDLSVAPSLPVLPSRGFLQNRSRARARDVHRVPVTSRIIDSPPPPVRLVFRRRRRIRNVYNTPGKNLPPARKRERRSPRNPSRPLLPVARTVCDPRVMIVLDELERIARACDLTLSRRRRRTTDRRLNTRN